MIYLILTATWTSIRYQQETGKERQERYRYAIQESLRWVPETVQPILVENSGASCDLLHFEHHGKVIPVIQTHHTMTYRNKGVNELLDLQEVIRQMNITGEDIIVKLTGRYRLLSPAIFQALESPGEVWMKFYNVCTRKPMKDDCVLGLFAIRAWHLQMISWRWLQLFDSPEVAIARYVRSSIPGNKIQELDVLGVECLFSETGEIMCL